MGDGFTTTCIVDLQSGTWMDADKCVQLNLTSDQTERMAVMSDSDRIEYALKHGRRMFVWEGETDNEGQCIIYTGVYLSPNDRK